MLEKIKYYKFGSEITNTGELKERDMMINYSEITFVAFRDLEDGEQNKHPYAVVGLSCGTRLCCPAYFWANPNTSTHC